MRKNISVAILLIVVLNCAVAWENYYYNTEGIEKRTLKIQDLCTFISEDHKQIECQIQTGSFLPESSLQSNEIKSFDQLKVVEYNIDRNGFGGDGPNEKGIQPIIDALKTLGDADVIILSEVARDCPQWGSYNGAEEIARAFKMDWAYSVEFLELDNSLFKLGYQCTIGNAILSNRPLSNIIQKQFKTQCCMFSGRAGGRVAIKATIESYNITLISSHLESGTGFEDFIDAMITREKQSQELVDMIDPIEEENKLIIIGGDFNSPLRQFNKGKPFREYQDPFMFKYLWPHRNTCVGDTLGYFGLSAFDYLYFKNHHGYHLDSFICKSQACTGFSDHFPIQVNISRM
ncbi:endonuclease/exonuclease/phosphatase family protein (macronuclear) [Tetrahymena thermophila SB210]|uniref:Endonuclease/exonuclease/phosphatase family protein n=1 Tax=Tetrahymena thermophila (strain SB210) TaxID=312017 RepID=I7M3A8_TETTS|nr:endonuclease/exonuclease/phosphatase family protein [Tetrahymena thermophila SB210]EAS02789.1 endonuclease/exonuclease/phosphatase family protein [Tetrahymena thermophila SB210]|eukprot:XP_001023034.1 endonuclease/exonuclease/phosphatase family protein [Tetrahymena thermophila SB210]